MRKDSEDEVNQITNRLEEGIKELFTSDKYTDYLKMLAKLHNYSASNALLIIMQNPTATMVAGYTSWKANFHRNVKKGEHGIKILAPAPYKVDKKVRKIDFATGKPVFDKEGKPVMDVIQVVVPAFKVVKVFDVSQTEGEPVPELATPLTGEVSNFKQLYNAIKLVSPAPIKFENIPDSANGYYDPINKEIVIKKGMSESQTLKTLIHELTHAVLHGDVLVDENDSDRRTREVEAESTAYTVCSHLGLDTSDYSFGYIAGWSSRMELPELKKSMNVIRNTAATIIHEIDGELLRPEKEIKQSMLAGEISDFIRAHAEDGLADKAVEDVRKDIASGNVKYLQSMLIKIEKNTIEKDDRKYARELSFSLEEYKSDMKIPDGKSSSKVKNVDSGKRSSRRR